MNCVFICPFCGVEHTFKLPWFASVVEEDDITGCGALDRLQCDAPHRNTGRLHVIGKNCESRCTECRVYGATRDGEFYSL